MNKIIGAHNKFGKEGEQLAVNYLLKHGYSIKYRNYRYLKGEIDILAQKGDILAVVEVKSRSSKDFGPIAETVTPKKIKLLVQTTDYYVIDNDLDVEVRFDIITIFKNYGVYEIEHLKNAFFHF